MTRSAFALFAKNFPYVLAALAIGVGRAAAQSQPETIPVAVAQAMSFQTPYLGRPRFFDARTPPDWPAALVPPGAKVLGGGTIGRSRTYRIQVAVFEFFPQSNPRAVLEDLAARAGFGPPTLQPSRSRAGGFIETVEMKVSAIFCKESTLATFQPVDSVRTPMVFVVSLLDGDAGRQACNPQENDVTTGPGVPVAVPTLSPPAGAMQVEGGSSWAGSSGTMTATLSTTMPADSVLAHYSAQLSAGGWKAEGRPANGDGVGAQRFSFREGQVAWTCALLVTGVGDRRTIVLQFSQRE